MFQGIIYGIPAILALAGIFIFRKTENQHLHRTLKVLVLFYLVIVFFRYMLSDSFIMVINKGIYDGQYIERKDILQSILRWGHYLSYVVYAMAVFFDSRTFKNISVYVCLPFSVITAAYFTDFIDYFMAEGGRGFVTARWFREAYFSLELIVSILIPLLIACCGRHYFHIKDKKEWGNFLLVLPCVILTLVPVYLPQSVIGIPVSSNATVEMLTIGNLVWIAITLIEIIILYLVFRFRSYRHRYMLCIFLALGLFMHYNSLFLMGFSIQRLPIQLCNLGAYFFVLALIIRNRSFFNFTFLANIMGTIIAMVAPDADGGFSGFWNFHYIVEHMQVLVVPMLCMLLRIFPRLEKRALKHLVIGFSIYFVCCWIAGTILNGYSDIGGYGRVNFFFIFDINKAADWAPFIRFTERYTITLFDKFVIYPVFQLMIYFGFLLLSILLYFLVMKLYDVLDDHFELRKARIRLYESLSGKPSGAKTEYDDDTGTHQERLNLKPKENT